MMSCCSHQRQAASVTPEEPLRLLRAAATRDCIWRSSSIISGRILGRHVAPVAPDPTDDDTSISGDAIGARCEEDVRAAVESARLRTGGNLVVKENRPTIAVPFQL